MAITPGTRFGPYEITASLGAGGMGEVYRATDTNLKREVALKLLSHAFADDADRIARFQREAEALAALNNPNIAQVYGLERSAGSTAIVMELVEGPTLSDRIAQGPIPHDEALSIARQVTDGLEAAHGKGIVHRDLKPANIKLTHDGVVKVLDFGIATAPESPLTTSGRRSPSALLTPALTEAGIILGTAAYMSPEQARGKPVDARSDIWAFGCVLYEMLTGQPAFGGEDVTTTLARILERDTDFSQLPAATSASARRALRLCLQKDLKERVADIRDVRLILRGVFEPTAPRLSPWIWVTASALGIAIAGVGSWNLKPAATSPVVDTRSDVLRFRIDVAPGQHLSGGVPFENFRASLQRPSRVSFALSPNGRYLVFAVSDGATVRLYRRRMDQAESTVIPGTEGGTQPTFSPDNGSVAFFAGNELKRVPIDGGEVRTVAISGAQPNFLAPVSWTEDDTLLIAATDGGTYEVPSNGGEAVQHTQIDAGAGEVGHLYAQMLPNRRGLLLNVFHEADVNVPSEGDIVVQSLGGNERKLIVDRGTHPVYLSSGHIIFARNGDLWAVPFDVMGLEATGAPAVVLEDVMLAESGPNSTLNSGAAQFSVSATGTLAFVPGGIYPGQRHSLVWLDVAGEPEELLLEPDRYLWPRFSPDGTRLVYAVGSFGDFRLWVYDVALAVAQPLTPQAAGEHWAPVWSPGGERIVFGRVGAGADAGLYLIAADGSEQIEQLAAITGAQPSSWSNSNGLALTAPTPEGPTGVWTLPIEDDGEAKPFGPTGAQVIAPVFSPDDRWIAYSSQETGRFEIYVGQFPEGPVYRISTDGGMAPVWSRDGRQLFYHWGDGPDAPLRFMAVDIATEPTFTRSRPRLLFEGPYAPCFPVRCYDISPDGKRFILIRRGEQEPQPVTEIDIVVNWFSELNERVRATP